MPDCDNEESCPCTGGLFTYNAGEQANPDDDVIDDITAELSGLRWEMPCTGGASFGNCTCEDPEDQTTVLSGESSTTYNVTLRFRGVIEPKDYTGGSNDGEFFQVGGSPAAGNNNIYSLIVSNPSQTYYLNRFHDGASGDMNIIDYTATIPIAGGASVTLRSESIEGVQHDNSDDLVVPGVPPDPEPYDGQFIQMDVVEIEVA